MDYKNAGVDIETGYKAVELMKKHTDSPEACNGTGRVENTSRSRIK